MEEKIIEGRTDKGWMILTDKNRIIVDKPIGKVTLIVETSKYLGKKRLRISKKILREVYDLLDNKTQRIRKQKPKEEGE